MKLSSRAREQHHGVRRGKDKEIKNMPNSNIIKRERQEVPELIDPALLVKAAAGQEDRKRVVVLHHKRLGVAEGLHRKMHQLLDQLSDSFAKQMESAGINVVHSRAPSIESFPASDPPAWISRDTRRTTAASPVWILKKVRRTEER